MNKLNKIITLLLLINHSSIIDKFFQLKIFILDLSFIKFDQRKASLQRDCVTVNSNFKDINNGTILFRILYFLIFVVLIVVQREKLNKIVRIDADAPLLIASHFDQMPR